MTNESQELLDALWIASRFGRIEEVRALLKLGIKPDLNPDPSRGAVAVSLSAGYLEIATELVKALGPNWKIFVEGDNWIIEETEVR